MSTGTTTPMDVITERLAAQPNTSSPGMRVVHAMPPEGLYERVDELLHLNPNRGAIFTWGSTIYCPRGGTVGPALLAHEGEHWKQQTDDEASIRAWWDRWLADPEYRLAQELPAHVAEYRVVCKMVPDRNKAAGFLINVIAKRLSDPMYGKLMKHTEAMRRIRELAAEPEKPRK